jgi:drug/metabolite transporter (DMT)-like permease
VKAIDARGAAQALLLSILWGANHTVLLGHFLLPDDRLTPRKLAGVLVAYAGIVLLFVLASALTGERLTIELFVASAAVAVGIGLTNTARRPARRRSL